MKYEAVFGDQSLFDGAPKDAEAVACVDGFNKLYYKFFDHRVYISMPSDLVWQLRTSEITHCMMSAMRRIIAEPKRWTVEDQKAGRLPEVGGVFTHRNETLTCLFIDADGEIWAHDINNRIVTPSLCNCYPLETQEERAQREEDEFVDSLRSVEIHGRTVGGYLNQGARAAYRKLKGGE